MFDLIKNMIRKTFKPALFSSSKKSRLSGQGMVEFALALPILLMVVYGLLESGRLIFIYSSTITAARQAARYGSTTGTGDSGVPYYRDCAGIQGAVNNVAFLNPYSDINITYDRGLDAAGDAVAIPGINADPTSDTCSSMDDDTLQNGDRIKVQVSSVWEPIIAIVPSWQGFTITSSAERTILRTIPIGVDPDSEIWVPGGALQLTVTSPVTSFNAPGQVISYTYTLYNNANFTLNAPFTVSDNIVSNESCSLAPGILAAGASTTCSGSYTTTQADVDNGFITNLASASSLETTTNQTGLTIPAVQLQELTLNKTPSTNLAAVEGTIVTYTYAMENTGNVTLAGPYTVTDNKIPSNLIDCSGAAATLAPGASTQCTAAYAITATDINNRSVTNFATAKAFFKGFEVTSNTDDAKVSTAPLDLAVVASPTSVSLLNQKITYTYTLSNLGATPLTAPHSITDSLAVNISCPAGSISAGGQITCTGEHYVTQPELDLGDDLINVATASSAGGTVTSNQASATVEINQVATISLAINPPANPGTIAVGTIINYNYVITNTGNAVLSAPYSIVESNIPTQPTCASTASLAPGATTTCTLAYTIKQSDIDKGSIQNLAIAKATLGSNQITSNQATATLITFASARITLGIASAPATFQNTSSPLSITFTLTNTGNSTVTSPYSVTANGFLGAISCPSTTPLAIGQQVQCTPVSYTPTAANLATGSISISGTATAANGGNPLTDAETLTIPSNFVCTTSHGTGGTRGVSFPRVNQLSVDITNSISSSDAIRISSIQLSNWNFSSHAQQYISTISLGGIQIYTGSSANRVSPITLSAPFSGNVILYPGETKTLLFAFNRNYSKTNSELVTITFAEYGCSTLIVGD